MLRNCSGLGHKISKEHILKEIDIQSVNLPQIAQGQVQALSNHPLVEIVQ
jgi:hypothetical protein